MQPPQSPPEQPAPKAEPQQTSYRWYHKVTAVATAVFCFQLGVFLLVYPWASDWNINSRIVPVWGREVWLSPWFRGAVSGLGLLNMYISFLEAFRLKRFSSLQ